MACVEKSNAIELCNTRIKKMYDPVNQSKPLMDFIVRVTMQNLPIVKRVRAKTSSDAVIDVLQQYRDDASALAMQIIVTKVI